MSSPLLTIYHSSLWFLSQQRQRQCQANSKVLKYPVFIQMTPQNFPKVYGSTTDNIVQRTLLNLCPEYTTYLRETQMNKRKLIRRRKNKYFARVLHKDARIFVFIAILGFSAIVLVNFAKAVFVNTVFIEQNYWVCKVTLNLVIPPHRILDIEKTLCTCFLLYKTLFHSRIPNKVVPLLFCLIAMAFVIKMRHFLFLPTTFSTILLVNCKLSIQIFMPATKPDFPKEYVQNTDNMTIEGLARAMW